jgi:5-formyltetrahydrofolate cyclo-ligase
MNTKKEFREHALALRSALSAYEHKKLSRAVLRNLFLLEEFQHAKMLHTYVSSKSNEVDTLELIVECLAQGKMVVVPISNMKTKEMKHSLLHSINDLQQGAYGLLEPSYLNTVAIAAIDTVIVPIVACDEKGNRIGFGGGFYDRFLKDVTCCKIGLAFEFQIFPNIIHENHDTRLDYIVSEHRIIKC